MKETSVTAGEWTLDVSEAPERADYKVILDGLAAFEENAAGPLNIRPLAIVIKDAEGATVGGLWGRSLFRWLNVELLYIPPGLRGRGLGEEIMARAEAIARSRDCIGIWLDTYDFQAPGFYEKLGFVSFGALDDIPPGRRRIFMRKRW